VHAEEFTTTHAGDGLPNSEPVSDGLLCAQWITLRRTAAQGIGSCWWRAAGGQVVNFSQALQRAGGGRTMWRSCKPHLDAEGGPGRDLAKWPHV